MVFESRFLSCSNITILWQILDRLSILKLVLNFEIFIYFFCWIEKKDKLLCNIFIDTPNLFYILKVPQNTFHCNIKKKVLIFDTNFNIQRPVQMTWYMNEKQLFIQLTLHFITFCRLKFIASSYTSRIQMAKLIKVWIL